MFVYSHVIVAITVYSNVYTKLLYTAIVYFCSVGKLIRCDIAYELGLFTVTDWNYFKWLKNIKLIWSEMQTYE